VFQSQLRQIVLEKPFTKIGLVEWLKVKALSSSPSTGKKKKEAEARKLRV
jgi:ribosomal protein S21